MGSPLHIDERSEGDARVERLPGGSAPDLLGWLDDGLRGGRRGRIEGEYGSALRDGASQHLLIREAGRPAAHALACTRRFHTEVGELAVGMIGLVYTDPAQRGRGLASRCVQTACEALEGLGARAILLWSDRPGFYARLGFRPAGRERLLLLDGALCERLAREVAAAGEVSPPRGSDWAALERLYAAKPARAERPPGFLQSLAAGPECRVVVCRRAGKICAYAALGRGDDYRDVVHEWAGDAPGVMQCLRVLSLGSPTLGLLAGPEGEGPMQVLAEAEVPCVERPLALALGADPAAWAHLPHLYVWGFDSI